MRAPALAPGSAVLLAALALLLSLDTHDAWARSKAVAANADSASGVGPVAGVDGTSEMSRASTDSTSEMKRTGNHEVDPGRPHSTPSLTSRVDLVVPGARGPIAVAGVAGAHGSVRTIPLDRDSLSAASVALGLAALEWRAGNLRAVVESLEGFDYASPSFPEADRAAFLLGQAYLRLGQRAR